MAEAPKTRQELYDRIRAGSKDGVVLEEMVRLGFWELQKLPNDPADDIARIHELRRTITSLASEVSHGRNMEALKAELHQRRLRAAKERRRETIVRREQARADKAAAWALRKGTQIGYVGEGMSGDLGRTEGTPRAGLPSLGDAAAIAAAAGVTVGELRFLAFHRKISQTTHYHRFAIPKKTGGTRLISAPMPRLKSMQHWLLRDVLSKLPVHDAAHGFVPGRSIVTNARAHLGRPVVVNFDLQDFFPTLTYPRVKGLFRSLGFSPEASTLLALVSTEPVVDEVALDGKRWFVHRSERHLPQGSPCSPVITNLVCVRLDQRLTGLARSLGFVYTRYADDLTFSGDPTRVATLLGAVRAIVEDEGFRLHPQKTHVMRATDAQEVTGLVVNEKLSVPRRQVRRFRAVLFQVERDGPAGKTFGASSDVLQSLMGFAAFVFMVDPAKGGPMLDDARRVAGWTRRPPTSPTPAPPDPAPEAPPPADKPKWFEFWKWGR